MDNCFGSSEAFRQKTLCYGKVGLGLDEYFNNVMGFVCSRISSFHLIKELLSFSCCQYSVGHAVSEQKGLPECFLTGLKSLQ